MTGLLNLGGSFRQEDRVQFEDCFVQNDLHAEGTLYVGLPNRAPISSSDHTRSQRFGREQMEEN